MATMPATEVIARVMSPSASRLCAEGGTALVDRVFERAVHLRTEQDALLVLAHEGVPQGGGMIRVIGTPPWVALVTPETRAWIDSRAITLAGASVDLRPASLWHPPAPPSRGARTAVDQALALASTIARTHAILHPAGLAPLAGLDIPSLPDPALATDLLRRVAPAVVLLGHALAAANDEGAREAANQLAGLGPGVTPSGDDLLLGAITGLRYTGADRVLPAALLAGAEGRTTWASAQLLRYALVGEVSAPLLTVASALVQGDIGAVEPTTGALLRVGETSGADALVGLVLGVTAGLALRGERLP